MSILGIRSRVKSLVKTVLGLEGPPSAPSNPEVRLEPNEGKVTEPLGSSAQSQEFSADSSSEAENLQAKDLQESEIKESEIKESENKESKPDLETTEQTPLKRAKPIELSSEDLEQLEHRSREKSENKESEQKESEQKENLMKVPVQINVQETPNPDACMFQVDVALIDSGTYEFKKGDDVSHAPLAQRLLGLEGVELILIAPRFVTVRKSPEIVWTSLTDKVITALEGFFNSPEDAVNSKEQSVDNSNLSDVELRILEVLDEEVRPAIAMDGGDLVYHGFQEGVVRIQLTGACGTCPSSTATLYYGVQNLLMEEIPEVKAVEQVSA
ncbi:MAG: hypothetical protein CMK59_15305 [Proteobacteria bacterium]|nr:hypothetical protein [Pseudomonadota bacterium]